jgi:hypothetical protein
MNGQTLIEIFERQVDDTTELSSVEELSVLNRVYKRICASRVWAFLKKTATGTISNNTITIPTDFLFFLENAQFTENNRTYEEPNAPKVIYVNNNPYKIINYNDKRQYKDKDGYAYIDWNAGVITFTTPTTGDYEFIYQSNPADITLSTTPKFPNMYHEFLVYGMAAENDIIQQSEKAKSYQMENETKFNTDLNNLIYWNSLQEMI